MTQIDDPVFGLLELRHSWEGNASVPFLSETLKVSISGTEAYPPSENINKNVTHFFKRVTFSNFQIFKFLRFSFFFF
jgi:hypothetical protein